jgi:hypothetical protein
LSSPVVESDDACVVRWEDRKGKNRLNVACMRVIRKFSGKHEGEIQIRNSVVGGMLTSK